VNKFYADFINLKHIGDCILDCTGLAFDFDGVMADTMGLFVDMVQEKYGRYDITLENITDYDLRKCIDVDLDVLIDIGSKIMAENCKDFLKPLPGCVGVLTNYVERFGKLVIITARPEKKPVEMWVKHYLEIADNDFKVIAAGDFDSKAFFLKEEGKTSIVEDRIETCFHLKENGFEPILFIQPWNRKENHFLEVGSWKDISDLCGMDYEGK